MRKKSLGKASRLEVKRSVTTTQEMLIPHDLNSSYLYSSFTNRPAIRQQRNGRQAIKHTFQLLLWFAALTTFFATQHALLHSDPMKTAAPVAAARPDSTPL